VIETLEEYISNLTHFKELLMRRLWRYIWRMQSVNKIKGILNGMHVKKLELKKINKN
jgi:prephenate dehydrogenase